MNTGNGTTVITGQVTQFSDRTYKRFWVLMEEPGSDWGTGRNKARTMVYQDTETGLLVMDVLRFESWIESQEKK